MIKYYCDWCNKETPDPHGGEFGRRINIVSRNDSITRINVCFKFEFVGPSVPDHLCRNCYVAKIREATDLLAGDVNG